MDSRPGPPGPPNGRRPPFSPPDPQEIWNDRITVVTHNLVGSSVECVFYGFHVILVFMLLYNHGSQWRQRYLSLSASYLLFAISTVIWGMGIYLSVKGVRGLRQGLPPGPPQFMDDLEWIRCGLFTISMLIGDTLLTWRVCALHRRAFWAILPQIGALVLAFGLGLSSFTCMIRSSMGHRFFESRPCSRIIFKGQQGTWVISAFLNLSATALLGRIAWRHSGILRRSEMNRNKVLHILYVLAIASAIYCFLWIPLLALLFIQNNSGGKPFTSRLSLVSIVFQSAFHQLVGIYPTSVTYLTLQSSSIFGGAEPYPSTRTRKPTTELSSSTYRSSYPSRRNLQVTIDEQVEAYEETTPAATKHFLPIAMEELPRRVQLDSRRGSGDEFKVDRDAAWR